MRSRDPEQCDASSVPLAVAARRAGRSYDWAYACAKGGRLELVPNSRPLSVTADSFDQLHFAMKRERLLKMLTRPKRKKRPYLRLVIDNT